MVCLTGLPSTKVLGYFRGGEAGIDSATRPLVFFNEVLVFLYLFSQALKVTPSQ